MTTGIELKTIGQMLPWGILCIMYVCSFLEDVLNLNVQCAWRRWSHNITNYIFAFASSWWQARLSRNEGDGNERQYNKLKYNHVVNLVGPYHTTVTEALVSTHGQCQRNMAFSFIDHTYQTTDSCYTVVSGCLAHISWSDSPEVCFFRCRSFSRVEV